MAYNLLPTPFTAFFDANGNPAAGHTLEFFIFNTSTPSALFSDSAGTALGTSCTLNSLGRPQTSGGAACQLFGSTEQTAGYKIVQKDSLGSIVQTFAGPVFPVLNSANVGDSVFAADLADNTDPDNGSDIIGHYDPIAPTYLKTVSDMINMEPIYLMRFLDAADRAVFVSGNRINTNDLGPRIQIALDALDDSGTAGGGTLILPRGVIMTGQELQIGHKTYVRGAGDGMTDTEVRLLTGSTVRSILTNMYYPTAQEFCGISNLYVNGNRGNATVSEANVLLNSLFVGSFVSNILSTNTTGHAMKVSNGGTAGGTEPPPGPYPAGSGPIRFQSCWLSNCTGYPLLIEEDTTRGAGAFGSFLLLDMTVENTLSDAGVKLKGQVASLQNVHIANLHVESSLAASADFAGLLIDGCPGVTLDGLMMIGGNADNPTGVGRAGVRITNQGRNVNIAARGITLVNPCEFIIDDLKNGYSSDGSISASAYVHYMTPECTFKAGAIDAESLTLNGPLTVDQLSVPELITLTEYAGPGAAAANQVYIYAQDNGSGKTRIMARFPSGAAQQIAIEP